MTNRTVVLVLFGVALLPGVGCAAPKPPTLCAGVTACSAAAETTGTAAGSTGTAAPSTQGIKYHPGHYAALDGMLRASNRSTLMAEHMRQIEELANEPNIVGVQLYVQWSALEGDTPGDYAAGIADATELSGCAGSYQEAPDGSAHSRSIRRLPSQRLVRCSSRRIFGKIRAGNMAQRRCATA